MPVRAAAKSVFKELPTELTAAMIVSEMPTRMSPYSIAVAPDSLDKKSASNVRIKDSGLKIHPTIPDFFFV